MMSTRRSLTLLTVCGVAMLALAGSAAAQNPDTTAATELPAADDSVAGFTPSSTPGYDSVDLTWDVPAAYRTTCRVPLAGSATQCAGSTAGDETPLTGFTVYYSSQTFASRTEFGVMSRNTTGGGLTDGSGMYELTGLDPEKTYFVTVVAHNAFGPANIVPASVMATTTGPAPVPAQVTGVTVTPGDMKLTVSWDEPNPDTGANRTDLNVVMYNVQHRTSQTVTNNPGAWMPMPPMVVSATPTPTADITGLTNGTKYDVQVRAVNDATGVGAYSAQSPRSSGTPGDDGDGDNGDGDNGDGDNGDGDNGDLMPPTDKPAVDLDAGDGMATVSWTAVAGATKYMVEWRTAAQTFGNAARQVTVSATEYKVSDLENGTEYMFRVTAANDDGPGPASDEAKATPMKAGTTVSAAPTSMPGVEVDAGDEMATVSWTAVAGATKYMVEWRTAAQTFGIAARQATVMNAMEYEVEDLENDTEYMFSVTAGNAAGYGPRSDEAKATPTDRPYISRVTNLRVDPGDMMLMASWGEPETGADMVKGYKVSTYSQGRQFKSEQDVGMAYEATIEGLTNGVEYEVRVCPYDDGEEDVYAQCVWSDPVAPMAPVPALPIFGAMALGAGLLAAGRARLRRRELRAGRVQLQINR